MEDNVQVLVAAPGESVCTLPDFEMLMRKAKDDTIKKQHVKERKEQRPGKTGKPYVRYLDYLTNEQV